MGFNSAFKGLNAGVRQIPRLTSKALANEDCVSLQIGFTFPSVVITIPAVFPC